MARDRTRSFRVERRQDCGIWDEKGRIEINLLPIGEGDLGPKLGLSTGEAWKEGKSPHSIRGVAISSDVPETRNASLTVTR